MPQDWRKHSRHSRYVLWRSGFSAGQPFGWRPSFAPLRAKLINLNFRWAYCNVICEGQIEPRGVEIIRTRHASSLQKFFYKLGSSGINFRPAHLGIQRMVAAHHLPDTQRRLKLDADVHFGGAEFAIREMDGNLANAETEPV